jgi:thymidylate synthase (FAD)
MILIKPSFEIIEQESGFEGVLKQIEKVGRTCYKSEDKIKEGSAKKFVDMLTTNCHGAMLEHGTVYLDLPYSLFDTMRHEGLADKYLNNKYTVCVPYTYYFEEGDVVGINKLAVTTNYRVLVENGWLDDLKYQCEPTKHHKKRITVKFVCDRGVSHEFVRHRVFSFAQESTRYCNYSKAKFGNELTFIEPCWEMEDLDRNVFIAALQSMESTYIGLTTIGWKPQQARAILPNSLKTELVMTGFIEDWKHFFELRCDTAAHPQARELAIPLQNWFKENNLIN